MRFLFTNEEIEAMRHAWWDRGFNWGAALGVGFTLAGCGLWALLVGVWS